jgi:hypothetical protein
MPFTPFHIGLSAWLALSLRGKIDPVVFVLSNVFIDIEPMLIGLYWPGLWAHGYLHTFLAGLPVGVVIGIICYFGRGVFERLKPLLRLQYEISFKNMLFSAVLGTWFHIILDALVDPDIHPFFPMKANPFFGFIPLSLARWLYALCIVPAALLFIKNYKKGRPVNKYNRFY